MQAFSSDSSEQCGQVQSCIRPSDAAGHTPRARMEMRGPGPDRYGELEGSWPYPGFPDPVSLTVVPYPSSDLLTFPTSSARLSLRQPAPAPDRPLSSSSTPRQSAPFDSPAPPRPASEPAMSLPAHRAGPPNAPAIAPVINSRLTSRWPIFDILPSRGLPPVEFCRGTSPSQAEKSRPPGSSPSAARRPG